MQSERGMNSIGRESERRLYNLEDAARELGGISVWTLRKHLAQGTIKATRLGRRVFLSAGELARIQREGLPSCTSRLSELVAPERHGSG